MSEKWKKVVTFSSHNFLSLLRQIFASCILALKSVQVLIRKHSNPLLKKLPLSSFHNSPALSHMGQKFFTYERTQLSDFAFYRIQSIIDFLLIFSTVYRTLARNGRSGEAFSRIGTRYLFVNNCSPLSVDTNVRRRKITSTESKGGLKRVIEFLPSRSLMPKLHGVERSKLQPCNAKI